jgi:primosomal protein N''
MSEPKRMTGQFELPLGRLVMNFGAIEETLGFGISVLISKDPRIGSTVASPLSFDARLLVYDALVRLRIADVQQLADHKRLMKNIKSLQQRRNSLIHGAWFDLENTNLDDIKGKLERPRLKLNKDFEERKMENVTPEDVFKEAKSAAGLCEQLSRAIKSYESSNGRGVK